MLLHHLPHCLLAKKKYVAADNVYQQALKLEPTNGSALRGRLDIRIAQQDWQRAQSLANSYSTKQQLVVAQKIKGIESEIIFSRLRLAIKNNDRAEMSNATDSLIALNPTSPWSRLDIANVINSLGENERADSLMGDWNRTSQDPEMKFAYALYLAQQDKRQEAIKQLETVDANLRTETMQRNLTRLKLDIELSDLQQRYLAQPKSVTDSLAALSAKYAGQVQPLARIVEAWIEIDHTEDAATIYRHISPLQQWSIDDQLAYGEMMVSLQQFVDFDLWYQKQFAYVESQSVSVSAVLQFEELKTRRVLAQADMFLAEHKTNEVVYSLSANLNQRRPFQTELRLVVQQVL